jgi:hypothetical protein
VNFVATGREFLPKFGRNDAGAAVGGVAGDTDFHARGLRQPQ